MAESAAHIRYGYLKQLSIAELETLLRTSALANEQADPAMIDYILEVMIEKEEMEGRLFDTEKPREDFERLYRNLSAPLYPSEAIPDQPAAIQENPSGKLSKRKSIRRILSVAALAAALLALTTIPVFGYSNVVQLVAHWTAEQFSFRQAGFAPEPDKSNLPIEVPEEYQELLETFQQKGLDSLAVPQYIPDGFQVVDSDLNVSSSTDKVEFYVLYQKDSDHIEFFLKQKNNSPTTVFEKDSTSVETYSYSGIEFYIFSNKNNTVTVWYKNGIEYCITTTSSMEEVTQIIQSMYEE